MASNAEAFAKLQRRVEALRSLGNVSKEIAPAVAAELRAGLDANIAAGRGPDGKAWQPTKAGEQPLRNAAAALTVKAVGSLVLAAINGHVARHHLGTAKGGIIRRILPTRRHLAPFYKAVRAVGMKAIAARLRDA